MGAGALRANTLVKVNTKAAAPALCMRAANIGQPKTTLDKPLSNCANSNAANS